MARRGRERGVGIRTTSPKAITWLIAAVLWLIGFADVILGVIHLPGKYGIWAFVIAGLLLLIATLVDGL